MTTTSSMILDALPQQLHPASGQERPRVVATIGKFDGVHAGHRHLVAQAVAEADRLGAHSAVVILHPDPVTVLTGRHVPLLTTVQERVDRLQDFGVDLVWPLAFDTALASLTPAAFLDRLAAGMEIAALVVGSDFAFGRGRAGTLDTLRGLAGERGFSVVVSEPLEVDGHKLGSRAVREVVATGEIGTATTLLRAPPRVVGTVVRGASRGRQLGFPTANLALVADYEVPAYGVYAVAARWTWPQPRRAGGHAYGLASIGVRPTFDNGPRTVEIYLLDFAGDLYGSEMTVDFLVRQRGEERYATAEDLIEQMHRDERDARRFLASWSRPVWERSPRQSADGEERWLARGTDLAALCEAAAIGIATRRDGTAAPSLAPRRESAPVGQPTMPAGGRQRYCLTFTAGGANEAGDGDASTLLEAWLRHVGGLDWRQAGAQVYYAGGGLLQALMEPAAANDGRSRSRPRLRGVDFATVNAWGHWEAEICLHPRALPRARG